MRAMKVPLRLAVLFPLLLRPCAAIATTWQQPTAEELSMTSAPGAPGVPAIFLFREETGDDNFHFEHTYVRLKVLTEDGKKYADVDMPSYERGLYKIDAVQGRTIHSDGTVVPFTGRPMDKLVEKTTDYQYHTSVFTMPDVQVGSIIEYSYDLTYPQGWATSPDWRVQWEVPVQSAHYHYIIAHSLEGYVAYTQSLPKGSDVVFIPGTDSYDLRLRDIPAVPIEDYMPPILSMSYRVKFYYSDATKAEEYWNKAGKEWFRSIDSFATPNGNIQAAVGQIVQPSDTSQQKLAKIYDAVMQLENTSFTRQHTEAENKAEGIKTRHADDIWGAKRGDDDEVALLFIAMARAAGFKAYAMGVTNRDTGMFSSSFWSMDQIDDIIAIVDVDGKEQYFDPGQRYCPFGQLHWKHTLAGGIRESDKGPVLAQSPSLSYSDTAVSRAADLTLGPNGQLSGSVKILMNGQEALKWRQAVLKFDEEQVKKDFQDSLLRSLPAGVQVKVDHFTGVDNPKVALGAVLDVSGSMGTSTSKRVLLPSCFFEASSRPIFAQEKRELPIDLRYPFQMGDKVTLKLPAAYEAESVPKDAKLSLAPRAAYGTKYKAEGGVYAQSRTLILASSYFDAKDYAEVRDFYQKMSAQDQEQLVLKAAAAPGTGQ